MYNTQVRTKCMKDKQSDEELEEKMDVRKKRRKGKHIKSLKKKRRVDDVRTVGGPIIQEGRMIDSSEEFDSDEESDDTLFHQKHDHEASISNQIAELLQEELKFVKETMKMTEYKAESEPNSDRRPRSTSIPFQAPISDDPPHEHEHNHPLVPEPFSNPLISDTSNPISPKVPQGFESQVEVDPNIDQPQDIL